MSMRAYFVEYNNRITDIDFFTVDLELVHIPIVLKYEGGLIETQYNISVWIPTGERTKVDPESPPLLYGTKNSYQLEYTNAPELEMIFNEAIMFDCLNWIEENRVEITLIEKMKIQQLDINENRENRWLVYSPERFPSIINMIKYNLDQEMRG